MKKYKINFFNLFNLYCLLIILSLINIFKTKEIQKQENYSKEYQNLYNFIISNGGYINKKLIPNEISNINRFIIAKEKIKKYEKLLFIPDIVLISRIHKNVFNYCREAYGFEEELDYDCIVYFMTIDKYNPSSFFRPYYEYLPIFNDSDFVFNFTQEEIKMLQETGINDGIFNYEYFLKRAFEPVKEILKKFSEKHNITYDKIIEDFKYNFNLVGTRNFGRPESYCDISTMVPFLDLINHSDKNNTYWYYEEMDNGYTLIAVRDIEKNEEITDSYGPYHNSKLYMTYGFVIPGNIYHEYVYTRINGEKYMLHLEYLDSTIESLFRKMVKEQNINFDEAKTSILKSLNDKKNYYLQLKTNRFSMNVIIQEHIDLLNVTIERVLKYEMPKK